jgi:peptidyl-prolyl cis-trans isomerase C
MKKDLLLTLIVIVVIAGLCFGLARIRPEFTPTKSHPYTLEETKSTSSSAPKTASSGGKVIMHVNGEPVTEQQFETFVNGMPQQAQQMLQLPQGRRVIAQQVASLVALAQEGRKMGIDNDKEVRSRLDADEMNVVAMATLRKLVTPDDAALRAEYEKRKESFDSVDLKHILIAYAGGKVPPRPGLNAPPLPLAMQKAQQIEAALQHGTDFAVIARAASDDTTSAQSGGEIGPVSRESLPPEVAAEVFALKPGQISKPLQTEFGIHIFKAGERKAPTFEQMKPQLEAEMQQKNASDTVERVRTSAKIELDPAFFGPEPPKRPAASPKNPS